MRSRLLIAAKIATAALLFYLIFRNVDVDRLHEAMAGVQVPFLVAVCALYPVGLLVAALKLQRLLQGYRMSMRLGAIFDLNWIAGFFNNLLPTSIGGDVYRALSLNRSFPEKPAQVVSSIILDRGFGLLAMLILGCAASPLFVSAVMPRNELAGVVQAACTAICVGALWFLFSTHGFRLRYRSRYVVVNKVVNGLNVLIGYPDKRNALYSLLVSFLFLGLTVLSNYLLFRAFGYDISVAALLFVIPVVSLAGMIPISINALGITEGVGVYLFSRLGVQPELALSALLTARVLQMLCSATGGVRLMFDRGLLAKPR